MATTKTAERMEAASTQAVKRGHTVIMIEVLDEEDDTTYQQWLAGGSPIASPKQRASALLTLPESLKTTSPLPNEGVGPTCVRKNEVTSPTVAMPSMASTKV